MLSCGSRLGGSTAQGRGIWDVCVLGKDSKLIRSGFPLEEEAVTRRRKPLQAPVELGGLPQALSPISQPLLLLFPMSL